jgi:hypothetical protein
MKGATLVTSLKLDEKKELQLRAIRYRTTVIAS